MINNVRTAGSEQQAVKSGKLEVERKNKKTETKNKIRTSSGQWKVGK
jgi:hypothetical protein